MFAQHIIICIFSAHRRVNTNDNDDCVWEIMCMSTKVFICRPLWAQCVRIIVEIWNKHVFDLEYSAYRSLMPYLTVKTYKLAFIVSAQPSLYLDKFTFSSIPISKMYHMMFVRCFLFFFQLNKLTCFHEINYYYSN